MRSTARGARAKKATPAQVIKDLENNIKEMNTRHSADLAEMQKRFEAENQQHLENILDSGEFILMANEYEDKLQTLQHKYDQLQQDYHTLETEHDDTIKRAHTLQNKVNELMPWKPKDVDYFQGAEVPSYDGLLLRHINMQRQKDEEMVVMQQEMAKRLEERDRIIAEEKNNQMQMLSDLAQMQRQQDESRNQHEQGITREKALQQQVWDLEDELKQKEKQMQLESQMIETISSNLEKNPAVGMMKREYVQKIESQERIIESLKEQGQVEIEHYKTLLEHARKDLLQAQKHTESIIQEKNNMQVKHQNSASRLEHIIGESHYQQRPVLKRLLTQMQEGIDTPEGQEKEEYIQDFRRVQAPQEEMARIEVGQQEYYEVVQRKGQEVVVQKRKTEGVEYNKVLLEVDGKVIVAAENVEAHQEGLHLDIQECLNYQKVLQQQIEQSGLDKQQCQQVQQNLLEMEQKLRLQQKLYLEKTLDEGPSGGVPLEKDEYYLAILQLKEQEIDRLQIQLSQKQRVVLTNGTYSPDEQMTLLKQSYQQVLAQNDQLQHNYRKMKDFYTQEIKKVSQEACQQSKVSQEHFESSGLKTNRQVAILQNKLQEVNEQYELAQEETQKMQMHNERLKQHNARIQEEIQWVRENYNQVLKNNLKLSQQLSQILGQITNSSILSSEQHQVQIQELKARIQ